jgi:tetratricopeptide (TPR) repeat protein
LAEKEKAHHEAEEHELFKYVTFFSRNKWRLVAGISLVVAVLIVIGAVQASRRKNEARAYAAHSQATTPKEYRSIYREFPRTFYGSTSLIRAGNLLYEEGKYVEARKLYLQYLGARPEDRLRPWVHNLVGATFEAEGKYDRAIEYYRRAEASAWLKLQAKLNIGRCYELKGDSEENAQSAAAQYDVARTYYRQLTETSGATAASARTITAWQQQAEERMRFLREKEKKAREREAEKNVDKTNP